MEINKRKFNIIVIFTVCLICLVVVFSSIDFTSAGNIDTINDTIADEGETEVPEVDDETEVVEEQEIPAAQKFTVNTKWQCLYSALNNLKKYDYYMSWHQEIPNPLNDQIVDKYLYKIENKNYIKIISKGYETFNEFGYSDETAVILYRNEKKLFTYSNYISEYGVAIAGIPYLLNNDTATIDNFTSDPLKDYYQLEVAVKPSGSKDYLKCMQKNSSAVKDPVMNSLTLTIKIDKKTCTINSVSAIEKYTVTSPIGPFNCTSKVIMTFKYKSYASSSAVAEIKTKLGI